MPSIAVQHEETPREPARRPAASRRDPALEILRGLAICEVVIHHVSGFARIHMYPSTVSHLLYSVLNRTLHFAVPAFLFLMALLLARGMASGRRSWGEFYRRRAQQTLVPYLIWSVIYLCFGVVRGRMDASALLVPGNWFHWLVWGKAWEHLYFLVLALQLYLLLPLLLSAVRRSRASLGALLVAAACAQLAFYWANQRWIRAPYPSTLLLWHLPPVLAGVWLGIHLDRWEAVWRRFRFVAIPLMLLGWAAYLPQGLRELQGLRLDGFSYQTAFWTYTLGVAFCLLAFSRYLARSARGLARGLQALGAQSMQIYLVHPMILSVWHATPQSGTTVQYHLKVLGVVVVVMGLSLGVSRLAARTKLGTIVFGRGDVPMAPLPGRG